MQEFLNKFSSKKREADERFLEDCRSIFARTIDIVLQTIGKKAFRPIGALNAAVFDSVMVGLARRISKGPIEDCTKVRPAYDELLIDREYFRLIIQSTADERNVSSRLKMAIEKFDSI